MKKIISAAALAALAVPVSAQDGDEPAPSPNQIVDSAPQSEWVAIPAEDLLLMELAPDRDGNARTVTIQLMPAPFSQGWVANIRTLARAEWYDGITINRVQDNYVVQWGDPNHDNPEAEGEPKPLPDGLKVMGEDEYSLSYSPQMFESIWFRGKRPATLEIFPVPPSVGIVTTNSDPYAKAFSFAGSMPIAIDLPRSSYEGRKLMSRPKTVWPVHCYGMVGVGRSYSPDTGSGAELYTVIGHAPRHLDRNIALVGRIIEGMEHLSSLPRGSGALGFYTAEENNKRTPIVSIRVISDLPTDQQPNFEYLNTESETFAKYAEARANRRDPFFIVPAGGADICNIPVPIRVASDD